jgi:hypothetical protein
VARLALIWINHDSRAVKQYNFAGVALMSVSDLQIGWLHKHKANAEDALRDLKSGRKIEIDEKDVTQELISSYEQIIAKYRELIVACRACSH